MKTIDQDVLFPKSATTKHPNASEVIKAAEIQGIGVKEIALLLDKAQPYISKVKAGQAGLKVEELQPLLERIAPKVPGSEFYTYRS